MRFNGVAAAANPEEALVEQLRWIDGYGKF